MGHGKDLWDQWETLVNKQDWAGAALLFNSDGVYLSPIGRHEGREAIGAFFAELGKASEVSIETSLVLEDGNNLVAEWTDRTTVTGSTTMPDGTEIAAAGRALELAGVTVATVTDGKFTTMREYFDSATLTSQLSG